MRCAPTVTIREDTLEFGQGSPSIFVEYHTRAVVALLTSLDHDPARHKAGTCGLLHAQLTELQRSDDR